MIVTLQREPTSVDELVRAEELVTNEPGVAAADPVPTARRTRWVERAASWPAWVGSRLFLAFALQLGYPSRHALLGDVDEYSSWADQLVHGHYPTHDPKWQYPPGAAGLFLAGHGLGGNAGFRWAFVALMAVADLAAYLVLRRRGTANAAVWVVGGVLLGPLVLYRFDVVPAAFALVGLAALRRGGAGRSAAGGAFLAAGALVKVWPAVLVLQAARRRVRPLLLGAIGLGAVAAVALASAGWLAAATGFAGQQRSRGLEIESLAALPWMIARCIEGSHTKPVTSYGAFEVHGGLVPAAGAVCTALTVLVLVLACVAALRGWSAVAPTSSSLALVLLLMVFSKVLSPQYLVWPLALAAYAVEAPNPAGGQVTPARPRGLRTAGLVLATCFVTQIEYPWAFSPVAKADPAALVVLVVRQLLFLALTVSALCDAAAGRSVLLARVESWFGRLGQRRAVAAGVVSSRVIQVP